MRRRMALREARRAIMQIARDTCYDDDGGGAHYRVVLRWNTAREETYGIGRGGTDPMSVAVLKIEGIRGQSREE